MLAFADRKKTAAPTDKYALVHITGKTGKPALSYKPGEEMIFTFELKTGNVKPGKWSFVYERKGDDGETFSGKVSALEPLIIKTSLDRPGFVSVNVSLVNGHGKTLTRINPRYGRMMPIGFYAGAAVQPETLKDCGEPEDFDAYWKERKTHLARVPFKDKVEKVLEKELDNGYIYAVTIPAPGPRPATGYMTLPRNAEKKSLPIRITFNGYGLFQQLPPENIAPDCIFFNLNAHGHELGREASYYEEFFKSVCTGNSSYAYDEELNKNPDTCYFYGMVMRVLRALEYLKTLPEWDGINITAAGSSQGGLQTMWAAALDQDVTVAEPAVTWCCDMAGRIKAGRTPGLYPIAYQRALEYYDPVFMAKRISKAEVIITRGGLGDYTCPPSGVAVSYNNLTTPQKTILWHQGSDHGFVPEEPEIITWTTKK